MEYVSCFGGVIFYCKQYNPNSGKNHLLLVLTFKGMKKAYRIVGVERVATEL